MNAGWVTQVRQVVAGLAAACALAAGAAVCLAAFVEPPSNTASVTVDVAADKACTGGEKVDATASSAQASAPGGCPGAGAAASTWVRNHVDAVTPVTPQNHAEPPDLHRLSVLRI